jgi:hypothetical protein
MRNYKLERLQRGESFMTSEKGNSMSPLIKSGQKVLLAAVNDTTAINVDDIVYCKVKGNFYTHLVKAKDQKKGFLIGNNKGGINGWTHQIYGRVVKLYGKIYTEE